MILAVILLFATAISLGFYMIYIGVRHHRGSPPVAYTHASVATLGLVLLTVFIFTESATYKLYNFAAVLLVMALIGGVVLLALRDGEKPPEMFLVMLHAVMALLAIALLVMGFFQY